MGVKDAIVGRTSRTERIGRRKRGTVRVGWGAFDGILVGVEGKYLFAGAE